MPSNQGQAEGPRADPALAGFPVTLLAWTHVTLASLGLAAGLALFVVLWTPQKPYLALAFYVWAWPVTLAVLLLLTPLAGGVGLIRRRPWARDMIIAVSAAYLFVFPLGTVLGGFGLWVLLRRCRVAAAAKRQGGRGALLLVMAGAVVLFAVILAAGYGLDRLGYTIPKRPPETKLVLGLSVLVLGGAFLAMQALLRGRSTRRLDATTAQDGDQA